MPDMDRTTGGTTDTTKQAAMGATAPATIQATTDHTPWEPQLQPPDGYRRHSYGHQ